MQVDCFAGKKSNFEKWKNINLILEVSNPLDMTYESRHSMRREGHKETSWG